MLGKQFPPSNSLHKIFNRNTVKLSYCCTQNLGNIIKSHNKKLISSNNQVILPCNCRKKKECQLEGKCKANDIIYKCIASATGFPYKVYLGTAERKFKKRFYNHKGRFPIDKMTADLKAKLFHHEIIFNFHMNNFGVIVAKK